MYYKKNFLANVILRLDFANISELSANPTREIKFSNDIQDQYPFLDFRKLKTQSQNEISVWEYKNEKDGKRYITLMSNALVFEYKHFQYEHFDSFYANVQVVLQIFQKNYLIREFTRLGLRYINEIEIPLPDPFHWEGYLSSELSQALKAGIIENMRVARSMHQLHFIKDDVITIFNYGLYNKSYPNPILTPAIILDYDCFIPKALPEEDILSSAQKLNKIAEKLFENSIGNSLREKMELLS